MGRHRLTTLDDRQLLISLRQLGFEGLVTLNYKMLRNPKELAAVLKTKLTVIAVEGVGHDPLRAAGALLLNLQQAVNAMAGRPHKIFWLRPRSPQPQDPWELFERAARNHRQEPTALYEEIRVTDAELKTRIL